MRPFIAILIIWGLPLFGWAQFKSPSASRAKSFTERKILYVQDNFVDVKQKEWFKKHWKFPQEIVFVPSGKLFGYISKKDKNAAILTVGEREEYFMEFGKKETVNPFVFAIYLGEEAGEALTKMIPADRKPELFKLSLPGQPFGEEEFVFIGQHFYNYLSKAFGSDDIAHADKIQIPGTAIAELSEKILLIPKENCGATAAEISEVYPYPFRIVDAAAIATVILNNSAEEAYMKMYFSDNGFNWSIFVMSTQEGRVLNKLGASGLTKDLTIATNAVPASAKPGLVLKQAHFKALAVRVKQRR